MIRKKKYFVIVDDSDCLGTGKSFHRVKEKFEKLQAIFARVARPRFEILIF